MRIKAPGEFLIGSGILIRPNVILTAAHNVYRLNSKAYATSIVAHVGVTTGGNAGAEAIGARVQCPPQYVACAGPNDPTRLAFDFAVIHLTTDALGKWTKPESIPDVLSQAPMSEPELRAAQLTLAGYPVYDSKPIVLRKCLGRIVSTTGTGLLYDMDSLPGQSGGPVFRINEPSKSITFAGLHTTGQEIENRARRWEASMQKTVKDWLGGAANSAAIA
jgi:V8-like Glu-specific endopeptidase